MSTAFVNGRVLGENGFVEGKAVVVDGSVIAGIVDVSELPAATDRHDLQGGLLVPGFIDTQVNGGGGTLFNDSPTVEAIRTIGQAHRQFGTTGFLPTLISDDLHVIRAGIDAVDAAIVEGVPGVLGIHVEGPFLNEQRKGIHDADKIRELDEEGLAVLTSARSGRTLVTVAPECTTPDMIRRLVEAGVIVSAGHTDATYAKMKTAIAAGVTGVTHLFNAMSQLTSREPGVVGAGLESDAVWCGIIVDGHHVDPATLRLALRCKPHDKLMLVTDAMPSVGTDVESFVLQGKRIGVKDGAVRDGSGRLAGSHLDMASAVRNAAGTLDLPLETAVGMASVFPAEFLGLEHERGAIAPGYFADLVLLDDDLTVRETWISGQRQKARKS
jgi:N-acetylglucosamine-6-phosphate deacetylase